MPHCLWESHPTLHPLPTSPERDSSSSVSWGGGGPLLTRTVLVTSSEFHSGVTAGLRCDPTG